LWKTLPLPFEVFKRIVQRRHSVEVAVSRRVYHSVLLAVLLVGTPLAETVTQRQTDVTARAVSAANRFLQRLTPEQRALAVLDYGSPKKATWHNGPPTLNPRQGVKLGDLTPEQRQAAMDLLRSMVGAYGYDKVLKIMSADERFGEIGATFPTGPNAYSVAIYGSPSPTAPWMLQWNGHHLGLNITVVGSHNVLAPTLTGAFPAVYEKDGKTVRVLDLETDRAFKLMNTLNRTQQAGAMLSYVVGDLVLGPGQDGKMIQPEGVKGSTMTGGQKAMLLDLTAAWVNILPEVSAAGKLAEIKSNIDDTYFAWSGDVTPGGRAYFRVQGPTVFIEYGPQINAGGAPRGGRAGANAGGPTRGDASAPPAQAAPRRGQPSSEVPANSPLRDPNHVHTIYRDFTNDYAKRFVTQ
jgi:uncharacterized protein DUF3500